MGKIRLLPQKLINQIAAGEVVQRPASVLKELLENAIDAKATTIKVYVEKAGKRLIQVIDDGIGMEPDDARMCFERHATSKIASPEDLYRLQTLGFRGEALASIAAVSDVELITRAKGTQIGSKVKISGGKWISFEQCEAPEGTSVKVQQLFFNVPARRKFLRSDITENKHLIQTFIALALSHPEILFEYYQDGKELYYLPKGDLQDRVLGLFPQLGESDLIPVDESNALFHLYGYLTKPDFATSRNESFFFVNTRFVRHGLIHHTIKQAHHSLLPEEKHPFYILFLTIDPSQIDVNVHPSKTEIKFADEQVVMKLLAPIIEKVLGDSLVFPSQGTKNESSTPFIPSSSSFHLEKNSPIISSSGGQKGKPWGFSWKDQLERLKIEAPPFLSEDYIQPSLLGEQEQKHLQREFWVSSQGYIFVLEGETLRIIHQRRAFFRIEYERLQKSTSQNRVISQKLLYPITIPLEPIMELELPLKKRLLEQVGVTVQLTEDQVLVTAAPPAFQFDEIERLVKQVLKIDHIIEKIQNYHEELIKILALQISKRKPLVRSAEEAEQLYKQLLDCEQPNVCPNHKPILFDLSLPSELLS